MVWVEAGGIHRGRRGVQSRGARDRPRFMLLYLTFCLTPSSRDANSVEREFLPRTRGSAGGYPDP